MERETGCDHETELREIRLFVDQILERNRRVEAEKAWETSWARKVVLMCLTYLVAVLFFNAAGVPNPFLNAAVPAAAFVMSTLTLPLFKKVWLSRLEKRRKAKDAGIQSS